MRGAWTSQNVTRSDISKGNIRVPIPAVAQLFPATGSSSTTIRCAFAIIIGTNHHAGAAAECRFSDGVDQHGKKRSGTISLGKPRMAALVESGHVAADAKLGISVQCDQQRPGSPIFVLTAARRAGTGNPRQAAAAVAAAPPVASVAKRKHAATAVGPHTSAASASGAHVAVKRRAEGCSASNPTGKRRKGKHALPLRRTLPSVGDDVEVEFKDAIYSDRVLDDVEGTQFKVKFDNDGPCRHALLGMHSPHLTHCMR